MKLYIEIRDGEPFLHPILEENLFAVFPDHDADSPPAGYVVFERSEPALPGPYYKGATSSYVLGEDGVCREEWYYEPMTPEEAQAKKDATTQMWESIGGFPSWVFDEISCRFYPPVLHPEDGKQYQWDEAALGWVEDYPNA